MKFFSPLHHDLTCGEQRFESQLIGLPIPPAVALTPVLVLEIGRAHGTVFAHMLDEFGVSMRVRCETRRRAFGARRLKVQHLSPIERVVLNRYKTRGVRPVFKQVAIGQQLIEPSRVVLPKPTPEHQVRAARDNTDGVDLQHVH